MKGFLTVVFTFFLCASAQAAMITFYVIETGLHPNAGRNRHSALLEDALMDVFFDAGHIVSNAPILRLVAKPDGGIVEAAKVRVDEASGSGSDFIVIAMLDFSEDTQQPVELSFYAFRISTPQIIYEKQIARRNGRSDRDEMNDLKIIVKDIIPFFNK